MELPSEDVLVGMLGEVGQDLLVVRVLHFLILYELRLRDTFNTYAFFGQKKIERALTYDLVFSFCYAYSVSDRDMPLFGSPSFPLTFYCFCYLSGLCY